MEKFRTLGLSEEILKVMKDAGFEEPSEIQEKTIPLALAGKDIIGGSATGSGKTLAFASPIVEKLLPGKGVQALILTPTRELAEQVSREIGKFSKKNKLKVLAIYGGVSIDQQMRKLPYTDVAVGTPGRILDLMRRDRLHLDKVKILVLDEVDRMFDMGFSHDVEMILKECPEERQTMMFSATISSDVDYLSRKYSKNPIEVSVKSYVDASKLRQTFYEVEYKEKFSLLLHLLKQETVELAMVFCNTRTNVDFVANNLKRYDVDAKAIHGGLSQNRRTQVLDDFHSKGVKVLICTDVAARGLDIKGVSHVYNYDIPKIKEDYIHRIGRTARAGKEGKAISLVSSNDYENFGQIMENESLKIEREIVPKFEIVFASKNLGSRERKSFGAARRGFGQKRSFGERRFGNRTQSRQGPRRGDSRRTNRDFRRSSRR